MITLLSKIFIKNSEDTTSPQVRQSYGILSGAVGICLNILLFIGKFFAGALSHSIAITADAFNNLSDAASSCITLVGFKMAGQKPDKDHPFGHGRIEYLTGLAVSAAILFMAFELIKSSISKLIKPEATTCNITIVIILICSIVIKLYMYLYNRSIGKKIRSEAMQATATDSLSDTLSTSVVLIATLISPFTTFPLDAFCGILVGIFIFYSGIMSAKDTLNPLLGQAPEPEFVKEIETLVLSYEDVLGIHDLIVHNYGPGRTMISLHAEVSAEGNILELHDMVDNIERALKERLKCEAVIHMDPICINDPQVKQLKTQVSSYLSSIDAALSLHDFRMVKGPTHTNIIFDVLVPYDFKYTDTEILKQVTDYIKSLDENYFAVINIDTRFV